jgi:hypothetical protein
MTGAKVTLGYSGLSDGDRLGGYHRFRNRLGFRCGLCRGGCGGEGLGADGGLNVLGDELGNGLRELRALAGPVVDAVALEGDGGGLGAGVVGTNHFDGATVTGAVLFDDDDTIVGLLAGANAGETNH